jgi:hypothetical protein
MKYTTPAILALAATFSATAQDLTTEVVVERNIKPVEQTATRLNGVYPAISAPRVDNKRLSAAEYSGQPTLTTVLTRLEPAPYADTIAVNPYRGYLAGGYFPAYNLGITAGYRLINTRRTAVGADLSFSGMSYKADGIDSYGDLARRTLSRNTFNIGAYAEHLFDAGRINATVNYGYTRLGQPYLADALEDGYTQGINRFDLGVNWTGGPVGEHITYGIGGNIATFGFSKGFKNGTTDFLLGGTTPSGLGDQSKDGEPVKEAVYKFNAYIGQKTDNGFRWQLDADANVQHLNRYTHIVWKDNFVGVNGYDDSHNYGIIGLTPTLGVEREHFNARFGARIDFLSGTDRATMHIAPAVHVAWTPSAAVSVWGSATGGEKLNTLASLFDYCPWMLGTITYAPSSVPFDLVAGVNIGPMSGFSAKLWGGWSKANSWLMPNVIDNNILRGIFNTFDAQDISGARFGIEARYTHGIFDVHASVEAAQSSLSSGYYLWRDRAKMAFSFGATVTPTDKLQIDIDYSLRTGRKSWLTYSENGSIWNSELKLGNVSNLCLGGRYSLTSALSVFLRLENILGNRHDIIANIQNQGFHGLLGAEFKF